MKKEDNKKEVRKSPPKKKYKLLVDFETTEKKYKAGDSIELTELGARTFKFKKRI